MTIKLCNISKYFCFKKQLIDVLSDVTLTISQKDIIAISGKSGSGKTTLLNIISGITMPSSGDVYFNNVKIKNNKFDKSISKIRSNEIGFIFQNFNLIPYLNVLENIILPLKFSNVPEHEHIEKGMNILKDLELENRADFYPTILSGGQMQRVAIARALIKEPSLIIADEPTGNLDIHTSNELIDIFKSLNQKNNISFLIVSHDTTILSQIDRHFKLLNGKLVE